MRTYTTNDIHVDIKTVVFFFPIRKARSDVSVILLWDAREPHTPFTPTFLAFSTLPPDLSFWILPASLGFAKIRPSTLIMIVLQSPQSLRLVAFKQLLIYYFTENITKRRSLINSECELKFHELFALSKQITVTIKCSPSYIFILRSGGE